MNQVFKNLRFPHDFSALTRISAARFFAGVVFAFGVLSGANLRGENRQTAEVFSGPPSNYSDVLALKDSSPDGTLRTFQVDERAGIARKGDLVRVPIFFAEKECPTLENLAIVALDDTAGGTEIPWQADDIRRGPDGGISRVHLWFAIDLKPGEKRHFRLIRRADPNSRAQAIAPTTIDSTGDELHVNTDNGVVGVSREGEIRILPVAGRECRFEAPGAFPQALIKYPPREKQPATDVVLDRSTAGREVEWSSGALFAKIRVRLAGTDGVALEQEYRIPRHGREIVITSALFPGDRPGGVVKENRLLQGTLTAASASAKIEKIPAGIRYALRAEHAYSITALNSAAGSGSLLAIPLVLGGPNGTWTIDDNRSVSLNGQRGLQRGAEGEKDTLYGFWTEVRLVPTKETDAARLWEIYREHVQPLVAVVEEPGATLERYHAVLRDVVHEMKPIGWRQEAGRALVLDDKARVANILQHGPSPREQDRESLLRGARGSRAKLTNNGERKLREDEKGRAYGGLDPYHITYTQSAAAALAALGDAPPSVTAVNLAMASGVREEGGRGDQAGNPYIDCYSRTLNMQLGPVLFGLTAGATAGDAALVRFYRDLATAPPVLAVFGRGQRPYTGAPTTAPEQTDYLYQGICDFWLRTSELLANEDLGLHPLAYARYTDCIDVMADRYHGVAAKDKPGTAGQARANFFRGQAHTHRWLGWSCAPFIRPLEDPGEHGAGLTEAIHYSETLKGRWKNWPDLTYYILADLLVRDGLSRYHRPNLPMAPDVPMVRQKSDGAEIEWKPVSGAAQYRLYRAETAGGPYRWINSPYAESPAAPLTTTSYHDASAKEGAVYVVTAVDAAGRQSPWPERPESGGN